MGELYLTAPKPELESVLGEAVRRERSKVPVGTPICFAIAVLVEGWAVHSSDALFLELQQCPISARSVPDAVPVQCPMQCPFSNQRGF